MVRIGVCGNTDVPCFEVIKSKGYGISAKMYLVEENKLKNSITEFTAVKDGNIFMGTLEEILGLITMWEYRSQNKNDWRANHDEVLEHLRILREAIIINVDGEIVDEENIIDNELDIIDED